MKKFLFFLLLFQFFVFCHRPFYLVTGINAGFFANFLLVLGSLDEYDNENANGLFVEFDENHLYYDPSLNQNWWENYFDPIKLGDIRHFVQDVESQELPLVFHARERLSRTRAKYLIDKYIHINSSIQNDVDTFVSTQLFSSYTMVGVHYRGTDKLISEAKRVSYSKMYEIMDEVRKEYYQVRFFIATDEEAFLNFCQEKFGEDICFFPQVRSKTDEPLHNGDLIENYQKGRLALIDCLLLSNCDILLRTKSNLSIVSTFFNPKIHDCLIEPLKKSQFFAWSEEVDSE